MVEGGAEIEGFIRSPYMPLFDLRADSYESPRHSFPRCMFNENSQLTNFSATFWRAFAKKLPEAEPVHPTVTMRGFARITPNRILALKDVMCRSGLPQAKSAAIPSTSDDQPRPAIRKEL